MDIHVTKRTVYGADLFYPANDPAKALATIAGTKTLSRYTLDQASGRMGHTVWLNCGPTQDDGCLPFREPYI